MKKFLFVAAFLGFAFGAQAQTNVIKVNILSPIVSTANVSFEHALSTTSSIQLGVAYTGASIGDTQLRGIQITPEYRFYLSGTDAPEGFYAAPFLRYANLSLTAPDFSTASGEAEASLTSIGGGLVLGKQWIFSEKIALDIFLGPSYINGSIDVEAGSEGSFDTGIFDGFGIRTGINFGFAF